ncbi:MAG: hypothetical protein ACFB4I_12165 [Cyanophyceae cyanobacterium]
MIRTNKIFLNLLTFPVFLAPIISTLVTAPAHSQELTFEAPTSACSSTGMGNLTCTRSQPNSLQAPRHFSEDAPMLEFSEAESDAAIALFGCDCIACVNAIRQMKGLPPV